MLRPITLRLYLAVTLFLSVWGQPSWGQQPAVRSNGGPSFRSADPLSAAAFDHFYDMDYDSSIQEFTQIQKRHPDDPDAVNHLLTAVLFHELYRIGALSAGEYSNDSFVDTKHRAADPHTCEQIKSLVAKAREARRIGFRAAKMEVCVKGPYAHNKLSEGDDAIIEIVAACRESVGPDFVMMVDVCYCWSNAKEALRVIRQLEPYDIFFLETPLQLDDLDGYAFLHDHCGIPIAAGELQDTRFEFLDLMDRGKVDVAQPDVGRVGGLTEARRVCEMAAERGRLIVPHCWKTGIGIAASAHLSAATEHCPYIEFLPAQLAESALRRELVRDELQMIDGVIPLPQGPGLGIELNQDALKKFRVQ